jgi:hypothetical protein
LKDYKEKDAEKIKKKLAAGATVREVKNDAEKAGIPLMTVYSWAKGAIVEKAKEIDDDRIINALNEEEEKVLKIYDQINARVPVIIGAGVKFSEIAMSLANYITYSVLKSLENVPDHIKGLQIVRFEPHVKLATYLANSSAQTLKTVLPDIDKEFAEKLLSLLSKKQEAHEIQFEVI